jgi:hypothetical protein
MPASKTGDAGFADAVDAAMRLPGGTDGSDLPDGFPLSIAPNHRVVDTSKEPQAIPGAIAYDFTVGRDVFVISRPWKNCQRCQDDMANNVLSLPTTGDHVCPHTRIAEYKALINRILAGECILKSETEIINKDDSLSISVYWLEKKLNHKKLRQMRKEAARQGMGTPPTGDEPDDDPSSI